MVSMKDIAQACGVSVASVSKALNNHTDIGEETRQLIRRTAKEMGYFPNSVARTLKTNRSYNLGVLFVDEANSGLTHDYFAGVLESFKETAERNDYDITFVNRNKERRRQMTYLEHARYRGFDGVVIACVDFEDPEVAQLVASDIPVVTIDHIFNNRIAVMSDNVKGMESLLQFIYSRGHRRIAYIHGHASSVTGSRLSSFYKTAEELGLDIPDEYVLEPGYRDTDAAAAATEELLKLPCPPTCILYPDDFSCLGGMNMLREKGLRIPEDISIAGYDGLRIGRHVEPKLTTLKQDTVKLGSYAAQKLIGQIERPKTSVPEIIVVEGEVYEGGSVGNIE